MIVWIVAYVVVRDLKEIYLNGIFKDITPLPHRKTPSNQNSLSLSGVTRLPVLLGCFCGLSLPSWPIFTKQFPQTSIIAIVW